MGGNLSLVVRNGTVIDGTGAPAFEADVAINDGKIVEIGKIAACGIEEIDARGKLVTPGFVDIHTHYDAQAVWDTQMTPSSWHGVTTGVMGNCGVGFAPCRVGDRQKLVELMEGVEDIPGAVMAEGLSWEWESFGEYLSALERRQRDIDLCALLPHAAVRVFVMGDRAIRHEAANQGDIAQMRQITEQAIRDGAFGVSTSRTISHKSLKGEYTPTLRAAEDELTGLAMGMKDAGAGFLELVGDWNQPDPVTEFAMLRRIIEKCGRTAVFSITQRHDRTEVWKDLLKMVDESNAAGVSIRPVAAPRAIGILLGLEGSQNPFSGTPTYKSIAHLPLAERVAAMRDPEIRAKILSDDPVKGSTFPLFHRMSYTKMFRFGHPANYEPKREDSITAIAERQNRTPEEVAYDILLEDGGRDFIYCPLVNYVDYDLSGPEAMLANKNTIMGLGDGGAHVGFIIDSGFPTWLLSYWGKQRNRWSTEELIRRLTSDTAGAAGLSDRGEIKLGKKGDLNILDWDKIAFGRPYVAYDLPTGGRRLLQRADGYEATVVSGHVTYRNGEATGKLPGQMVRGQR